MNWESKFSSIVQETEANLAKVKEKLRGKATLSPSVSFDSNYYNDYSRLSPRLHSSVHYPVSSTPKARLTSDHTTSYTTHSSLTKPSYHNTLHLQNKIDEQSKTIDDLTRTVRNLEKERGQYQDQIRQLRNEVSKLSTLMLDQGGGNPHLEWQMDQMKRTLLREVQEVRDQLRVFRQRVDKHSATEHNTSLTIGKDIDEVRQDIQEELQYVRRDLDVLKKRLGSVEMGVMSAHYDKRDLERSQDRMNLSLREITNGRTRNLVDILRTCPDADRSNNHLQVDQLRGTVQSLKDKLDRVETRLHDTMSPYKASSGAFRTVTKGETTKTYDDVDDDIESDYDDVDLSSDLSIDLEDSDIEVSTSDNKRTTTRKVSFSPDISDDDDDDDDDGQLGASSLGSVDVDDLDIDDFDIDDDIDI